VITRDNASFGFGDAIAAAERSVNASLNSGNVLSRMQLTGSSEDELLEFETNEQANGTMRDHTVLSTDGELPHAGGMMRQLENCPYVDECPVTSNDTLPQNAFALDTTT
jgi:hypothetical protein